MSPKKRIHNHKYLKAFRKRLRVNLTDAEAFFWNQIKTRKFHNLKFRRQHSIKNYIVDYYCAEYQLIIELDGDYHNDPEQHDKDLRRDEELENLGFTVLRFENRYAFEELEHVLEDIKKHCRKE
jgi:very-short-patch-repair endonuclease